MEIPKTMKGVVCYGPKDYRMEKDLPVPTPGPNELLVKVSAVGICAGDAKCYEGAAHFWGDKEREQYCQPPIVPGHEFVGIVVKFGHGAEVKHNVEIGDQVISEQIVPCWNCRYCRKGSYHLCVPHDIYGFHQRTPGAMAQYMIFPANSITHKIDNNVPPTRAVFVEPLSCSIHAVNLGNIQFNDVVVISGSGSLGLGMIAAAAQKRPAKLIALDMLDWKLELAKKCGATHTFNPHNLNVVEEVKKLSDGYGCDVYIEASGHPSSVKQGLSMICKQGTFVEYSVFCAETSCDWTIISDAKELTIKGGHLSPGCFPKAIAMIENEELPIDEIVTHTLPLEQYETGLSMVFSAEKSVKVCLLP